ncbi:hypothetical protein FGO68_gene17724 [Halteria grandinella]|uniref:Uncharacterized protein n=1 Tax=Halteria grandinella TaxID=5974 RepID=A0A8J8SZL1_HALGN|nr:hypothetical protein FGO68_gene17724 [Halteria grandinella]
MFKHKNIILQMQLDFSKLICRHCSQCYNLNDREPMTMTCCSTEACQKCFRFKLCNGQHSYRGEQSITQRQTNSQKIIMLGSLKNLKRFVCHGCKVRTVEYYCGKEQVFLCLQCLVKSCKSHADEWEELTNEDLKQLGNKLKDWPEGALFSQRIREIGRDLLDTSTVIINEDLSKLVGGLRKLNELEVNDQTDKGDEAQTEDLTKSDYIELPQDKKGEVEQLGIKLAEILKL